MKYNDFYWANDASLQFMYPDYLDQNETPQSRVRDIANNAESILGINGFADKFYNYMAKGYYSLSTPVWKNFGKKNGSPISCFGIDIQDDTSDILKGVAEIGMMTKQGGGTAGYFGKLRPRGANISGGSKSNGSVSFMPLFQEVTNTISQTNRRGFFAAYHDIDHDDFDEFMKARTEGDTLQTIALALCVSDDFMNRVENGDKEAQRRWVKVIKKRDESGFPYLYFTDTANKNKPQVYKDKNMMLRHSQMCVSYDTLILTDNGYKCIGELEDTFVNVWNGQEFSEVEINQTGENQTLFRVEVDCITYDLKGNIIKTETKILDCTEYHKWYNYMGQELRTNVLRPNDSLLHSDLPNTTDRVKYVVRSIQKLDSLHDTYCFTEPKRNMGMFNGILTGNCNEIYEYTDENVSFVCALSSINLLHWDEVKNTDAIETLTYFMDAVYTEFINKSENIPFMDKAVRFAKDHRSIGIGVLGWHSYLQRNNLPFACMDSNFKTTEIFKTIDDLTLKASKELALKFGEPTILKGYGERFTTRVALAPTTSSSFILGQISPSIEPLLSNCFLKDLSKGKFFWKNPFLEELLEKKGINNDDVWDKIMKKDGSVQYLDELDENEKEIFKTFAEISQKEIIIQASIRQKFIDQGQSLNLMLHPETTMKENNQLLFLSWELGLKGLYYQRSANVAQKVSRDITNCSSCES